MNWMHSSRERIEVGLAGLGVGRDCAWAVLRRMYFLSAIIVSIPAVVLEARVQSTGDAEMTHETSAEAVFSSSRPFADLSPLSPPSTTSHTLFLVPQR